MRTLNGTRRAEAFSDGVLAIAATLLVLELKPPVSSDVPHFGMALALAEMWPAYLAFATSVLTIPANPCPLDTATLDAFTSSLSAVTKLRKICQKTAPLII